MQRHQVLTRRAGALFVAAIAFAAASAGCHRTTILLVNVTGDVVVPIDSLRVTLTYMTESHDLVYPPASGTTTITLPTSFSVRVTSGVENGVPLEVRVTAVGGGVDLATGTDAHPVDLGQVVNYSVALVAIGPGCGDGNLDAGETCDGSNVGGADCVSIGQGFVGGTLGCAPDCLSYDTSTCTAPPGCGDGAVVPPEQCDGVDLAGQTCETQGLDGGTLGCTGGCVFDLSGCTGCGNGVAETGEACDGADVGTFTCQSLGFDGGTLSCNAACTYDLGGCTTCGNGLAETGEDCDGADLASNDCTTAGAFQGGTLACNAATCTFDTSLCIACGDGAAEGSEQCDGVDLNANDCTTIGQGYVGGMLACAADC
ncbi:MAG TPA: hypothetical protein VG389_04380, partial [Myxococcota bacterium]|nr:hypothetical protein [Myxococcota bacterium]